jgi:RHS repeat-associated protein
MPQRVNRGEGGGNCNPTGASLCTRFDHGNDHALTKIHYPNGVDEDFNPGPSGQPRSAKATKGAAILTNLTYDYHAQCPVGAEGELIGTRTDNTTSPVSVTTFCHDSYNRLTQAKTMKGAIVVTDYGYAYDPTGNLTSARVGTNYTNYGYDTQNRLCNNNATSGSPATLTCPASPTYTFDAAGNQLVGGGHTISGYNAKNQTGTIETINNTFADADQTERTAAGSTTFNTWLLGQDTPPPCPAPPRYYLRTPDGMLIGTSQGSTHHYYLDDGEMNIVGLTNSSGVSTAYYTYDPYGAHPTATGADAALNNYRYKSGWLNNSDIYKLGARYYHASGARWTQQDPIAGTIGNPPTPQPLHLHRRQPHRQLGPHRTRLLGRRCIPNRR